MDFAPRRNPRRGWLALAAIPLTIVPAFVAGFLFDPSTDLGVIVTVLFAMYGILLGIPVLLSIAIESFRGPRISAGGASTSRTALVVHTILLVAHDLSLFYGGVDRCRRGDVPYWLIGYVPLLVIANVKIFHAWRKPSLTRERELLPRTR